MHSFGESSSAACAASPRHEWLIHRPADWVYVRAFSMLPVGMVPVPSSGRLSVVALLAALLALALTRRAPQVARKIIGACLIGIYVLSTPIASTWMLGSLQSAYVDPRTPIFNSLLGSGSLVAPHFSKA